MTVVSKLAKLKINNIHANRNADNFQLVLNVDDFFQVIVSHYNIFVVSSLTQKRKLERIVL